MKSNTLAVLSAMFLTVSSQAVTIRTHQDASGFPFLIPSVQKLEKKQGTFTLPQQLQVAASAETAHELTVLDRLLSQRFAGCHAVKVQPGAAAACVFELTANGVPENTQGYALSIKPQGISIKAKTPQGIFYGVQTLGNFIANCNSAALPCCDITDWPDLATRGIFLDIRWLKDADAPQFAKTFDMLGALKLNAIELDCGANLPFENSPFTNYKSTISKENLAKIIQAAKDNYVEIVPHLQVISHNQWLRAHPKFFTDITATGDDKTRKYNSTWNSCNCPAKPLGRELTDYTIRETVKLFNPRYFHLCLDELELCNWQKCETCKEPHTIQQIVDEIKHTVEVVKSLNVRPVVYQDSLLEARSNNSKLAEPLRKMMPRDVVISFWDYAIMPKANQFKYFQELGFADIVGVSFCYRLANTMTLPLMIKQMGGNGSILTYWGWINKLFLDNSANNSNAAASTVINAEYAWRAHQDFTHVTMPYDPAYQLRRRIPLPYPVRRPTDTFAAISMAAQCDTKIGDDITFLRLTPQIAADIRREAAALPEHFDVQPAADNGLAAIVIGGGNDSYAREAVSIPVNAKMKGLAFLMTAGIPDNPDAFGYRFSGLRPTIANLKISYANGKEVTQPLRYRLHFNNWNEQSSGAESRFVIRGNDAVGNTYSLYAYDWDNPSPDETITAIEIAPAEKRGVAMAVFAVSAWQPLSPLPQQGQVRANLRNATAGLQGLDTKPTDITDFTNRGLADCKVSVEGKFGELKPSWKLIDMPDAPIPGKALEIIVPPQVSSTLGRSRAILDIPVKANTPLKALVADYRVVGEYQSNVHNGFYRTNHDMSKYEVCYGGIVSPNEDWQHIVIPETRMPAEFDAPLTPDEYRTVRFSIWFEGNTKPIRFIINRVGYYDFCAGWMQQLLRDKITE